VNPAADPLAVLRSRGYLGLPLFTAILGVPVSAAAFGFLKLVDLLQEWIFKDLPSGLGFHGAPTWWPLPLLAVGGALVAAAIRYLPGKGGESPAEGSGRGARPRPLSSRASPWRRWRRSALAPCSGRRRR
jgi:hypothetical protein